MSNNNQILPFTALLGQDEMKLALVLNVIDPKIGGVLIMGDRGTGKSTAVRSLADLLPDLTVVKNDPYNSDPFNPELMGPETRREWNTRHSMGLLQNFGLDVIKTPMVDLPLGATEDRVCGTINLEAALTDGVRAFEPGLLAKANRGFLYVDEVNLLDNHLVDILLDSAASGWNTVEREGMSMKHPAKFVLIGSGNPEEGELRPQLLDRFGMLVEVKTPRDPKLRLQIVELRTQFDQRPEEIMSKFAESQVNLRKQLSRAQSLLADVKIDNDLKTKISDLCSFLNIDGLRGDMVVNRAAKAYAALYNRKEVTLSDVKKIVVLCLRHRLRKDPFATIDSGDQVLEGFNSIFSIDD
uniref:Mg-protoporphyrin IX chelatase n=1 Tax=Olisthodiscus luteus TaxID=83000 RepID=A0A7U0KSG9_OLILU|nr:Mg chelatase subunit e [Olisthodiscus luteus]QQW50542.1 Mg chelatase subunit e [Olisthodiscus luteus]